MRQKYILSTFIIIIYNWVHIAAQNEFPDFTKRYTKKDSIEGQKRLDWIKNINKLNLTDTNFTAKISNNFFYKQLNYFELSLKKQNLGKDSIILTSSFRNTSPHNVYVCLGWWINDSLINKSLDIDVLDMLYFGLDCFTNFKMESVQCQATISEIFKVKKSEFERVNYNISLIHNMESFVHSSKDLIFFTKCIHPNKILVDGILDGRVLEYKGLTNIYIYNFPLDNTEQNVRIIVENNK